MNRAALPEPASQALEKVSIAFHDIDYSGPIGVAWAPGRVNLIGEHTDYNEGFVLPIAVNRVATLAGRPRGDQKIRIWSTHFEEFAQFSLEGLPGTFAQERDAVPGWARYILGVVAELARANVPLSAFDAVLHGDVPVGGGMSSSAALEVATVEACALFSAGRFTLRTEGATLKPMEVAALCQHAEQVASGVQCGILDQAASCLGRPGQATLLDCRSLAYNYLPFNAPEIALVVIDTSVRRELASSAYNERREQCKEAANILRAEIMQRDPQNEAARSISTLRDVTQNQFEHYAQFLPTVLRKRAGYIIAEDERVLEAADLLRKEKVEALGPLLWQSHAGLRDEYEVSCVELDTLVEIAHQIPGVLGSRMLGGGFGGCTISLVQTGSIEALRRAVEQQYPARTGLQASIDICKAAGGPGSAWVR